MENMKLITKISIASLLILFAFSCVQDDDYAVPQSIGLEENQKLVEWNEGYITV